MFNTILVGHKIAELRKQKNMTQMELADLMGVSYQAVSNWERGNSMPDIAKLEDLSKALEVTIDMLLGNEKPIQLAKHILEGNANQFIQEDKVSVEDLEEIAPILKPEQANEAFESFAGRQDKPMTLANLIGMAPFLGSKYLDRFVQNISVEKLGELADIAPFISQSVLGDLALRVVETGSIKDLAHLAPFLPKEVLHQLIAPFFKPDEPVSLANLTYLAPFLGSKYLDRLVQNLSVESLGELAGLAPFVSRSVLGELASKAVETGSIKDLTHLAPFLPKEVLHQLAEKIIAEKGLSGIGPIAPFL